MVNFINNLFDGLLVVIILSFCLLFIYSKYRKKSFKEISDSLLNYVTGENKVKTIKEKTQQVWQKKTI